MALESPRALVTFDRAHPNADEFLDALEATFAERFLGEMWPGVVVIVLRTNAPNADAQEIMDESARQNCPALVGYPRLFR